jgi:hypothetical protein
MRHRSGYLRSRREPWDQVTSTESLVEAPLFAEASFTGDHQSAASAAISLPHWSKPLRSR